MAATGDESPPLDSRGLRTGDASSNRGGIRFGLPEWRAIRADGVLACMSGNRRDGMDRRPDNVKCEIVPVVAGVTGS